jgi:hypothetical protein
MACGKLERLLNTPSVEGGGTHLFASAALNSQCCVVRIDEVEVVN